MADTYISIPGEIKLLQQENDFIFSVELWLLNDAVNRNGWQFVNLAEHREKWAGIPILTAYVNGGSKIGDGHNMREKYDPDTGETYSSFTDASAERIVGALSDNPDDIRMVERDENTWIVGKGYLYAFYAYELVKKIVNDAQQGRVMELSIEALVTKSRQEGNVEVEENYIPIGATLLGDGVVPAVDGAHVAMLSELESEFKELKLRAASYLDQSTENKPKIPTEKGVKQHMRLSKQQLRELQAKFGEDYIVHAAEQRDDCVIVCLANKAGKTAIYRMASLDEAVVLDRIEDTNAQVHFCAEGCDDVLVDACDLVESVATENNSLLARLSASETALGEATATIERMVSTENARRLSAAKATATATLDAFNANREVKVDAKCLESLNGDIDAGKFTSLCDENGAWIGESAVAEKVLSLCATAVMEYDKQTAKKAGEAMTWGSVKKASTAPGTIGELFSKH